MERQIIARDRAEVRATDQNDMQKFASKSMENIGFDGVGPGRYYAGLDVSQQGPTDVRVAPGRFWEAGVIYVREENLQLGLQSLDFSLFEFLPVEHEVAVAMVVWGLEQDTNVEPRDFLVDLNTRVTEPQAVPMHRMRLATIDMIGGTESPQPQVPPIPGGVLHFCTVYLGPTGILRIEMVESARVPSAEGNRIDLSELRAWQLAIAAQIETLRSLLAKIQELIAGFAPLREIRALAVDVARLKVRWRLPDFYSAYSADWFLFAELSDTSFSGYDARVEDGLLFPVESSVTANLALLNSSDPNVTVMDGRVWPRFSSVRRFGTTGRDGDMPLAYEQQSFELQTFEAATFVHTYGWSYNQYVNWWAQQYNQNVDFGQGGMPGTGVSHANKTNYAYNWTLEWNRNWTLEPVEHQYLAPTTTTVVGALVAQTFLAPAAMWMTKVHLNFTKIDTSGDVTVVICKTAKTGEPLLKESLATTSVPLAQLRLYPTETEVAIAPCFLSAGERYAICLLTQGSHRVATVSGEKHTQGNLFYSTSGAFFEGDITKDLLFSIYAAKFEQARVVVPLQPISLSGGISDIKIDAPAFRPDGASLIYEMQVGGQWRPFTEPTYHLESLPDVLPLRAVFQGTTDVMPALTLASDAIFASRAKTSLTHFSVLRTLPSASSDILVYIVSHNFVQASHTLTVTLMDGGTEHSSAIAEIEELDDGSTQHKFEFDLGTAIDEYRIKIAATRQSSATAPFVIVERMDVAT